jgi:peptide/nickel transport system ATP-binding protein
MSPLLDIQNLQVAFPAGRGPAAVQAVDRLSCALYAGKTLGLVGESGSGKSTVARTILRLLPAAAVAGQIRWQDQIDLLKASEAEIRAIRGRQIAIIFQEPLSALNPVRACGAQLEENIRLYQGCDKQSAAVQARHLLERVGLEAPDRIARSYPHEISGGQKQRVLIAMAMSGTPRLLIADEPTTALDVRVQKTIIDLLKSLQAEFGMSMLFISHDLGLIGDLADEIAVLRAGHLEEIGPANTVLHQPQSAYTQGLLACRPALQRRYRRLPTIEAPTPEPFVVPEPDAANTARPILEVSRLSVQYQGARSLFGVKKQPFHALDNVCFEVYPGETLGIVGASGSGKTTLGKVVARMLEPSAGTLRFEGHSLEDSPRRQIQMIFQDPYAALNPTMRVGDALLEALQLADPQSGKQTVMDLLEMVGLQPAHYDRYPRAFSGGQRQRLSIARALALRPRMLVCDEITSSLDVSVQATILNLLRDLQAQFQLPYLFISHDLAVIRQMSDRVLVLRDGCVDAYGAPEHVLDRAPTDYVRMLLEAAPGWGRAQRGE